MANHGGGVGAKFVSVNLNKSYGQSSHHNHPSYSGTYGPAPAPGPAGRGRPGGGGGMVVLSRSRGLQKAGPKLSVPPPLNLPSLRKEHERFDLPGSGSGPVGSAGAGTGPRPTSSGMGWTKPVGIALQEKDGSLGDTNLEQSGNGVDVGETRVSSAYMPPSARSSGSGVGVTSSVSARPFPPVERAVVLRGEDFPSLRATLPVSSGPGMKQKDNVNQKQKQAVVEASNEHQKDGYHFSSLVDMRPQGQPSRHTSGNGPMESSEVHGFGSSQMADPHWKDEFFPGPLPLVQLNPRSDWADDERDTGHRFADHSSDLGFSKSESYWDREFDMPRASVLPHKPAHNQYERRGLRDGETGRNFSSEVFRSDPYRRDSGIPSREGREGNMWRSSSLHKDGLNVQEAANDRHSIGARTTGLNKDFGKENMHIPPRAGDPSCDGGVSINQETTYGRRDMGHVSEGRPPWNQIKESFNSRVAEHNARDRYGTEQSTRYRGDSFQKTNMSKSLLASGGRMPLETDPVLTSGREKHKLSKTERSYLEDPFIGSAGFDEGDPFTGSIVGVIKRKKDLVKQADFHDPVRESFEAELERVQKMQELERQRVHEEQERALEQARREEEERQRLTREEEEQRRRLVEEAREAQWRAEQEQLEAIRREEELKIAREEEKKRIFMEEERRKQSARQKLLELEARMAKREAEAVKPDTSVATNNIEEKFATSMKNKDIPTSADTDTWEDSERIGERKTASVSFDSPVLSRPFDISSRPYPTREGSSSFLDRGKPFNSWRRDVFENGSSSSSQLQDQEVSHLSPRSDSFANGRTISRKEFYGGAGFVPSRTIVRGLVQEPYADEFGHQKEQRWNFPGDADSYSRSRDLDLEYQDNLAEKYGDIGWGQSRFRGNTWPPQPERQYPNFEADELGSYGRSRYSMRQPRVFPPPSISSTQRTSFRGANEHTGRSESLDNNDHYSHTDINESARQTGFYAGNRDCLQQSELVDMQKQTTCEDQKLNKDMAPRCDSQSSVSVSSPPNTPPHLSHDELDESGDSPMLLATAEGKQMSLSANNSVILNDNGGQRLIMTASSSISAVEDDEWTVENNDELQQQEEYDEDEDGYEEEDEAREGDDENLDLNEEFDDLHLAEKSSTHIMDNLVLGFDEGVEVEIPSDDFERNLSNDDRGFGIADPSVHVVGENGLVDGLQGDQHSAELLDGSPQPIIAPETEKTVQDSVTEPTNDLYTSITSPNISLSAEPATSSSVDLPLSTGPKTMIAASAPNQVDIPVKLQFGLFSGPSLIPSPLPAIQIGSIQMPLHLHPPVGPSLTHLHPSQPPIFQFGQLRYTSPISQGVLPIPPQSMSFVQPNVQTHYSLNQNHGGSLPIQPTQDASTQSVMKDDVPSHAVNKQPGFVSRLPDQPHDPSVGFTSFQESADNSAHTQITTAKVAGSDDDKLALQSPAQAEVGRQHDTVTEPPLLSPRRRVSESHLHDIQTTGEPISSEKNFSGMKPHGPFSGSRGKRFTYAFRNSGMRSSFPASDLSFSDTNGFQRRSRRTVQRTEFRVRENVERRQQAGSVSSNNLHPDDKSNYNGRANGNVARSGSKRGTISGKPLKQVKDSESLVSSNFSSQEIDSANRVGKEIGKDVSVRVQNLSESGEGNLRRNMSEEDVDAPLQSGVVRVFKQPGIEAPSDEDDFIEVRSKRQMLNDRREQREKEIKAKSRVSKPPRKPRAARPPVVGSTNPKKVSASSGGESTQKICSDFTPSEGGDLACKEASAALVSQPLAPIGTPAVKSEIQSEKKSQIKPLQTSSLSIVSGSKDLGPTLMFENKNKVMDNVPTSLSSWDTARVNQQVMALTQTQLEEAMKPPRFETPIASLGSHGIAASEPLLPSSSILSKERSFSSASSPINSLLAGEKIQFGAVTSPTILPPSNWAPGSSRPDIHSSRNRAAEEDNCALFFEKDKQTDDSCAQLQDSEAEAAAEAAASAVAVAAISNDEVVGNGLGSVALSDVKSFESTDIEGITTGMAGEQQLTSQSRAEESLSVSLPADLSVETPPISLWPPLPSPQSASSQMLSHFPGGPPSHFPFYEMNPMLGGPIFAFGPHEESAGSQSQPQKSSTTSTSGPLGTWQQCHSTVDSFYGPPAGFTGPFISPPGGIPGVQGPPHMVVYNHFAPVGQFGQVGLSFMGPTYIPSGKPPDWKHNAPSSVGMGDGDLNNVNNLNIGSAQRNPPNMAPIQHLAQGSPLMPMASPLAMFDVSPFQSPPDMSVQARWSHVPASPLHTVPLSRPLQEQTEGVAPSQFGQTHPIDQSINLSRFSDPRTSSESGPSFSVAAEVNAGHFPHELGLVDSSRSTTAGASTIAVSQSLSACATVDASKTDNGRNGGSNKSEGNSTGGFKTRSLQQKNLSAQQGHSASYNYQRGGGTSQRNNTGNDWSNRRMGFQGRNQSFGADKGFPSSKVKQIYVAKQTSSGTSNE